MSTGADLARLVAGEHPDPHAVLGPHGGEVRAWRPDARKVTVVTRAGARTPLAPVDPAGVFAGDVDPAALVGGYRLEVAYGPGRVFTSEDPFRFGPTVTLDDLRQLARGSHERLWEVLGAHVRDVDGVAGTSFAVWAPNARAVRAVGDFNSWDGRLHPMRRLEPGGVWEIFVPGVAAGARYKFELVTADGRLVLKADPLAFATDLPPGTASVVHETTHRWGDDDWLAERRQADPLGQRLSVYEVHLGSWRLGLGYRQLAVELVDHVAALGFTHVELLPVAEHPFGPSWGYQVTGYFAPTARYGTPDDFRALVDAFHRRGIGVLVDWVPAHFPRDDWALARFDGTPLYEHPDPRRGEHPDWGTFVFDYGRPEVANFLRANARFWIEELHVDGLRVDAVASMLYLDYSRGDGGWEPNVHGGRENLEAVAFLQELNTELHGDGDQGGILTVAEESTTWPGVSHPVAQGGLGFTHKWNMGWMHDTLRHFSRPPAERPSHHHELTFGLTYAFSEHFVLPLSHDEVVHGKGTLLTRMPGDRPQQLANLRALLGWMWALPGAPLLFMGGELGQDREWASDRSLDWHLLDHAGHAGVQALVRRLNRVARQEAALWSGEYEPAGFEWIDADDAEGSCYAFLRLAVGEHSGERPVACLANFTDRPRHGYRVGLPRGGGWEVLVHSDAAEVGGDGFPAGPEVDAEPLPWQGWDHSGLLTLPPLAVLWLAPRG